MADGFAPDLLKNVLIVPFKREDRKDILDLRLSGMSPAAIAEKRGLSVSAVTVLLKRLTRNLYLGVSA